MSVYNVSNRSNRALQIMLQVHEYLLMRSHTCEYVDYHDLRQFYASITSPQSCAALLEKVGIAYRDSHPTKKGVANPKAIFFQDRELLDRAVAEIKAEIETRKKRGHPAGGRSRKWKERAKHYKQRDPVYSADTVASIDFLNSVFSPRPQAAR